MKARRRVAVTGMGVVCPLGLSVSSFLEGLLAGRSAAGPITLFDASGMPTRIAAEVRWPSPVRRDRKITFAVEAARQAWAEASASGRPRGRGGLSLGIGLELFSLDDMAEHRGGRALPEGAEQRLSYVQSPSDLCAHLISRELGLELPPAAHVSACAAGTDALGSAYRLVAEGRRDWAVAGGTDSMINPMGIGGFCKIEAMTKSNDDPRRASRPFDKRRDGFLLGEGAAMLVLEPLEEARARGAVIHAEIAGYGNSFDAHGISEPHPEGRGAYEAMQGALDDAGIGPDQVDAVNAHGTSTPKNDPVETLALKRLLGARAKSVPVSATKSMIGHLISAAGAVEAVAAIACMKAGWAHPTINLEEPDPACDLDYVAGRARRHVARCVLSNSFGFGGQNAAVVIRSHEA
jgi:3-oxoacyl-[acyl-carrier-protein] synthase II